MIKGLIPAIDEQIAALEKQKAEAQAKETAYEAKVASIGQLETEMQANLARLQEQVGKFFSDTKAQFARELGLGPGVIAALEDDDVIRHSPDAATTNGISRRINDPANNY